MILLESLNKSKTGALNITNKMMLNITSFCLCLFFIWMLKWNDVNYFLK